MKGTVLQWALDLLYPRKCPFCDRVLERGIEGMCGRCPDELPWVRGAAFEVPGCQLVCSALWYEGRVADGIVRYKFRHAKRHSAIFGLLMAQALDEVCREMPDVVVWVPLSAQHLRRRGYDQAELLARRVAELKGLPVAGALVKRRNTRTQSHLHGAKARAKNVAGAYACRGEADVRGLRVLLVDDVFTTGATLSQCAQCLRQAGARSVVGITLARAR